MAVDIGQETTAEDQIRAWQIAVIDQEQEVTASLEIHGVTPQWLLLDENEFQLDNGERY